MSELPPVRVRAKFFFEGDRKFFIKGVTYGPFKPNADGDYLPSPERARQDFALMAELGVNLLRIYHVPPAWFLDLCREFGLRVLVSIPWMEHVEFLNDRKIRAQILNTIREAVAKNRGHEAIFAYLVGNEIPTTMVRWLGAKRVTYFVERLINAAREIDPRPLYSYASYPPTEYLLPQNVDFFCFNVYLHNQRDFERYLARLQNLAEDKPLILGEFGMDTIRHTEEEQAEMLGWHVDSVVQGGAAGTIFFSWTDEWFTGGAEITDWAFGLVTRDRVPKKAFHALKEKLRGDGPITQRVKLREYPKVSVIVCSYNGAQDARGLSRFPAETQLSRLRSHPRGRRLEGQHAGDREKVSVREKHPPAEYGAELRAQRGSGRRNGRHLCVHGLRLHGGSGLALLHGRHAAERRLRRAWAGRTFRRPR